MRKRFIIDILALATLCILIRGGGPEIQWSISTYKIPRVPSIPFETYESASLSPDGEYLASVASESKELVIHKIAPDGKLEKIHSAAIDFDAPPQEKEPAINKLPQRAGIYDDPTLPDERDKPALSLSWADEGSTIVACASNQIAIFDAKNNYAAVIPFKTLFPSPKYSNIGSFRKAWVSPGARYITVEQRNEKLTDIWVFERTGERWQEIRKLENLTGTTNTARFSGDGKYLAILSDDMRIEETASGKIVATRKEVTRQSADSFRNAIFPDHTFIMQNSGYLSYYDISSQTAYSDKNLPEEIIAFDKTGARIFGLRHNGLLHVYSIPPGKRPREEKDLMMDPTTRSTNFEIWAYFRYPVDELYPEFYPFKRPRPSPNLLLGMAARPDGKLLILFSETGFKEYERRYDPKVSLQGEARINSSQNIYPLQNLSPQRWTYHHEKISCRMEVRDIPLLMKLDEAKMNRTSTYSAAAVLIIGLIWLIVQEFGSIILARIKNNKAV